MPVLIRQRLEDLQHPHEVETEQFHQVEGMER